MNQTEFERIFDELLGPEAAAKMFENAKPYIKRRLLQKRILVCVGVGLGTTALIVGLYHLFLL